MDTSFMSEKSAELILVPNLVSVLSRNFNTVIPIYYWATREGNKLSRKCDDNNKILVLAMYARRPKIKEPYQPTIGVKINSQLFSYANFLETNGIPVIAGVPLVSSIIRIDQSISCLWFRVDGFNNKNNDVYYDISLEYKEVINSNAITNDIINENDIEQIIKENCSYMTWNKAIDIFSGLGKYRDQYLPYYPQRFPWFSFSSYKPIYFLLK